jgi:hypothetical protein
MMVGDAQTDILVRLEPAVAREEDEMWGVEGEGVREGQLTVVEAFSVGRIFWPCNGKMPYQKVVLEIF